MSRRSPACGSPMADRSVGSTRFLVSSKTHPPLTLARRRRVRGVPPITCMIRNSGPALNLARAFALHALTFSQRIGSRAHPTRLPDSRPERPRLRCEVPSQSTLDSQQCIRLAEPSWRLRRPATLYVPWLAAARPPRVAAQSCFAPGPAAPSMSRRSPACGSPEKRRLSYLYIRIAFSPRKPLRAPI
jgi:hypothetical protein